MTTADYSLYLATDADLLPTEDLQLFSLLERCLSQGVSVFQLRLKGVSTRRFYEIGLRVREITRACQVPLLINDRLDLALAVQADGVHLGRDDLPVSEARRLWPEGILGYSVNRIEDLAVAATASVDYVGVGPVFPTATKRDTGPVLGLSGLREIVREARVPCVAIGNMSLANAAEAVAAGAAGICVISTVFKADDPARAVAALRREIERARHGRSVDIPGSSRQRESSGTDRASPG